MKSSYGYTIMSALIIAGISANVEATFTSQAMALIKFRRNFPASTASFSTWITFDPCDGTWVGVLCDKDGLVVSLDLNGNGLNGTLSPAIGQLTGLLKLLLYNNHLSGPIPVELGLLTRVQTVWLFNNDLSGGIPSELGKMSSCTELALYNNHLTGPVPSTLAQVLALRVTPGNNLCSTIPGQPCPTQQPSPTSYPDSIPPQPPITPPASAPSPSPGVVSAGPVYPPMSPHLSPDSAPTPAPLSLPFRCPLCADGLTAGPYASECTCVAASAYVLRFTNLSFGSYTAAQEEGVLSVLAGQLHMQISQLRVVGRSAGSVILRIDLLPLQGVSFTSGQVQSITSVLQNCTESGLTPQYAYTILCEPCPQPAQKDQGLEVNGVIITPLYLSSLSRAAAPYLVVAVVAVAPPPPAATGSRGGSKSGSEAAYIGALAGGSMLALLLAGFTLWCCCVRNRRGVEVVIAGKSASEKTWANVPVKKQLVYTSVWSVKPKAVPQTPLFGGPQGGITDSGVKRLEEGEHSSNVSSSLPNRILTFDFNDYQSEDSRGEGEGEGKAKVGEGEKLEDVPLSELQTEVFPFKALQTATRQFCKEAVLGEGSFGKIYKAELASSRVVAVVCLSEGKMETGDFLRHVEGLGDSKNPFALHPIGYCAEKGRRVVVYPYMPNKSLKDHLHGELRFCRRLTWHKRIRIAADVAEGLTRMHEGGREVSVHKDVRGSTILLDENFRGKLSLYPRSALTPVQAPISKSNSRPYQAPELRAGEEETPKADVFALGVILLELFTGRKPLDMGRPKGQQSLLSWILPQLDSRRALASMVDPYLRLNSSLDSRTLHSFVMLAGRCLHHDPHARPAMAAVCAELKHLMANDTSTCESKSEVVMVKKEGEENWGGRFPQSYSSDESTGAESIPPLAANSHPDPYLPRATAGPHPNHTHQMSPPTLPSRPPSPKPRPASPSPHAGGRWSSPTAGHTCARPSSARSPLTSPMLPRQQVGGGEEGVQTAMDKWDEIRKEYEPQAMEGLTLRSRLHCAEWGSRVSSHIHVHSKVVPSR